MLNTRLIEETSRRLDAVFAQNVASLSERIEFNALKDAWCCLLTGGRQKPKSSTLIYFINKASESEIETQGYYTELLKELSNYGQEGNQ